MKSKMSTADVWLFVKEELIKAGFGGELIHGLRHMNHVRSECELLCDLNPHLDAKVVKCLRVAVDVHDLGRTQKGDHAVISAELFSNLVIEDLEEEERDAVHYAVKNHSRGLKTLGVERAHTLSEIVLGLLCICDHADAASPDGAGRSALALKAKQVLSDNFSANHLLELIENGCNPNLMNVYKNDSLVAHWAYNYTATRGIFAPVNHLLSDQYKTESESRLAMYRAIIDPLLRLQKEKDETEF